MNLRKYILFFVLFLLASAKIWASGNHIKVVTDRGIYVSGEVVLAKVFLTNGESSKVVYLDLLNKNGTHIVGAKLKVENKKAVGYVSIPDSLSSGSCFLKVFTDQNKGSAYVLKELLVVNRFEPNDKRLVVDKIPLEEENVQELNASVEGLSDSYSKREPIKINVSIPERLLSSIDGDLLVSVVDQPNDFSLGSTTIINETSDFQYANENKGIVLQGRVSEKLGGEPVSGATIMASVPDSIPFFDYYKTDANGYFYFLMNDFYGTTPLIIQTRKNPENKDLKIDIFEKFRDTPVQFEKNTESLSGSLNQFAQKSTQIVNFKRFFNVNEFVLESKERQLMYSYPFYGEPDFQVNPDDYVDLPDFYTISKELLPTVKFREDDDGYNLNIVNLPLKTFFGTKPFVMLDGVPIDNIPLISKLGSKDIDWIDVVPRQRFYGDLSFNGVLAIYTKKRDASMITGSGHLLKFEYEGLQNEIRLSDNYSKMKNIPDLRQVLLWEPNTKPEKDIHFSFRTSDVKGNYQLSIVGLTKSGEIIKYVQTFKVN